jgi:hypothetical protein
LRHLTILFAAAVVACDGPRENAGEKADFETGAVNSEDTLRKGPAEKLGEKQDRAAETRERAGDAEADALEAAADERREQADQEADALDNRAEAIRSQ